MRDLVVERMHDGARRSFDFLADGRRDSSAIRRFLEGSTGRVVELFDQVGDRDLRVQPGTRGPILDPDQPTDGAPGLMFDNGGAFEGNPNAYGRPYYAVALGNGTPELDLHRGVTVIARLRVAHEASIAGGALLQLGLHSAEKLILLSGDPDPHRPVSDAIDMSMLFGGLMALAPPLPSSVETFALAADERGFTAGTTGHLRNATTGLAGNVAWDGLLLGTTGAGAGDGWELETLAVFDRRLAGDELTRAMEAIGPAWRREPAVTLVLDGSSVEAGVGSTALRNLTRLYERRWPQAAIYNVAVGGATSADRLAALPSTLGIFNGRGGVRILVCGAGANALARGVPASVVHRQMQDYVRQAHARQPGLLVGLTTIIPLAVGLDAGFGPNFDQYNALLRGDRAGADFLIDRASDQVMGDPRTIRPHLDRRYSTDGAHPTDLGYRRLASIDTASIAAALETTACSNGGRASDGRDGFDRCRATKKGSALHDRVCCSNSLGVTLLRRTNQRPSGMRETR